MASSVKYHKTYLRLHKEYEAYAYPIIKKALDDCYTADDILKGLINNSFQLFISWNKKVECAVVTEVAQYPQKKMMLQFYKN